MARIIEVTVGDTRFASMVDDVQFDTATSRSLDTTISVHNSTYLAIVGAGKRAVLPVQREKAGVVYQVGSTYDITPSGVYLYNYPTDSFVRIGHDSTPITDLAGKTVSWGQDLYPPVWGYAVVYGGNPGVTREEI